MADLDTPTFLADREVARVRTVPTAQLAAALEERALRRANARAAAAACRCDTYDEYISDEEEQRPTVRDHIGARGVELARERAVGEPFADVGLRVDPDSVEHRRGHWTPRLDDPCDECAGDGVTRYGDTPELCTWCDGAGLSVASLDDDWPLTWQDDPTGCAWTHAETVEVDGG